jgi:hypothetical protein
MIVEPEESIPPKRRPTTGHDTEALNFAGEKLALLLCIRVEISARKSAILTQTVSGLPQSLQNKCRDSTLN